MTYPTELHDWKACACPDCDLLRWEIRQERGR